MELTAVIETFRALPKPCFVDFYTDSAYVKDRITKRIKNWNVNGGWEITESFR